jgi:ketosteroid isomerase-like protein
MPEQTFKPGNQTSVASDSLTHPHSAFFEEAGETCDRAAYLEYVGEVERKMQNRRARALNGILAIAFMAAVMSVAGCHRPQSASHAEGTKKEIADLRAAYAAFNRGDIDGAVKPLDPGVEWIEPAEFPGGGTYHGVEEAKRYLAQSRAGADEVISEPEQFVFTGDRIVVFVHARVRPKGSTAWRDIKLADVYTFRNGKAVQMRAFNERQEALQWSRSTER